MRQSAGVDDVELSDVKSGYIAVLRRAIPGASPRQLADAADVLLRSLLPGGMPNIEAGIVDADVDEMRQIFGTKLAKFGPTGKRRIVVKNLNKAQRSWKPGRRKLS